MFLYIELTQIVNKIIFLHEDSDSSIVYNLYHVLMTHIDLFYGDYSGFSNKKVTLNVRM